MAFFAVSEAVGAHNRFHAFHALHAGNGHSAPAARLEARAPAPAPAPKPLTKAALPEKKTNGTHPQGGFRRF